VPLGILCIRSFLTLWMSMNSHRFRDTSDLRRSGGIVNLFRGKAGITNLMAILLAILLLCVRMFVGL